MELFLYQCKICKTNVYSRKYKKLQDISGSIGGIIKIINTFSFLINYFFYKFQLIKDFNQDFNDNYMFLKNKFDKSDILSIMKIKSINFLNKKKIRKYKKWKN